MNRTDNFGPARPSRRGFTLVELLVVIGIIALLISILLPTLASARRSAASVACLSNQRQLAAASSFFINDHKGFVMKQWLNGRAIGANASDAGNLSISGGSSNQNWGYKPGLWGWDWVLKGYVNADNGVFACPSDPSAIRRGEWNNPAGYTPFPADEPDRTVDDIPASYRLNISNQSNDWTAYKITELKNATQAILITDANPATYHQIESWDYSPVASGGWASFGPGKEQIANMAPKRHSAEDKIFRGDPLSPTATPIFKINAAFADGHGASIPYDETFVPNGEVVSYATRNNFGVMTGQTAVGVPTMWRQIFRSGDQIDTYKNPNTPDDDGNASPG